MNLMSVLPLVLLAVSTPQRDVVQQSTGWCSPNVANVAGKVTINCIGVDPRALKRLNDELSMRNEELSRKIQEADDWAQRYHELELRLKNTDNEVSRQAAEYLHQGELEKAGAILDKLLQKEEKDVDLIASNHYNRGLIFELEFQPKKALPYLEKAYQYRPSSLKYVEEYGKALVAASDFEKAETILSASITLAREMVKTNPSYERDLALTLDSLATLYINTARIEKAGQDFEEALQIWRRLVKQNPEYEFELAKTLDGLGVFYDISGRPKESEAASKEALSICQKLAKASSNHALYDFEVARSLNHLAILFVHTQRMPDALAAFQESVAGYRVLAEANPGAYQPYVAIALGNLGLFYSKIGSFKEAEEALEENLNYYRRLAKDDPLEYRIAIALTLNNLATIYARTGRLQEAKTGFQEALELRRQLAKENPAAYELDVTATLNDFGAFYREAHQNKEAESILQEALTIRRRLANANPPFRPFVAETLENLAELHLNMHHSRQGLREIEEAIGILKDLWKSNPSGIGDDLANSLLLKLKLLDLHGAKQSELCSLAREGQTVANDPKLKQSLQERLQQCP